MNLDNYQQLMDYLTTGQLPQQLDIKQWTTLKRQVTHYLIQNHILFQRNTKTPTEPLRVIKATELESTLHNLHENILTGHFGIEVTYNRARSRYY